MFSASTNNYLQALVLRVLALCMLQLFVASGALWAANEKALVALFGDSITVGYNSSYSQVDIGNGTTTHGAPTIELNKLLNQDTPKRPSIVSNWGDGGTSSENGTWRIIRELNILNSQYSNQLKLVLILYGTNDAAFDITTADTRFNIEIMIDNARARGFEPIIGTLTPVEGRDVGPRNSQIAAAANSKGAFLVDHFTRFINQPGGWRTLIEEDNGERLHPNNDGYRVIAETWFENRLKDIIPIGKSVGSIAAVNSLLLSTEPDPEPEIIPE